MKIKKHGAVRYYRAGQNSGELLRMGICAGVFLIIALVIRIITGSPYRAVSYCNLEHIFPAVWLFTLIRIAWYIALGAVFGAVFGSRSCRDEVNKYKGGMIFVAMLAIGYLWYPMFFGAMALFVALIVAEVVLALAVLCALCFMRVKKWAAWVMLAYAGWMLCLVVMNLMSLFAN